MKKLMLWLSIVLAIGLTAQTAKAATTPSELWVSYSTGNGWTWNQSMSKDGDVFSFTFPAGEVFYAITRVNNLGDNSWNANNAGGFNVYASQYTFGTYNDKNDHEPADGQVLQVYGNCNHILKMSADKARTIYVYPTSGDNEGYTNMMFSFTKPQIQVQSANMPLKPADFANGKKHYFLVGSRQADWRLQPEWEFSEEITVDGQKAMMIDGARVMYTGRVEIGVVDNYNDYINQRYTRWGGQDGATCINLSTRYIKNLKNRGTFEYYNANYGRDDAYTWCPTGAQADYFAASTDTNFGYAAVRDSKGAVASTVVLKLDGNGNPTEWYLTIPDNNNAQSAFDAVPQYLTFSLVGETITNSSLSDAKKTPKNMSTWQDAWIQYDENGQPYRDAKGTLMYQTVFQPEWLSNHPSYFNKTLADGRPFDYTSRNLVMTNVKNMSAKELAEDPYAALYNRFNGNGTLGGGGDKGHQVTVGDFNYNEVLENHVGASNTNYNTRSANWQCFVVKDMWIDGEFKVWTGWGGGQKRNEDTGASQGDGDYKNARWYFVNGGHGEPGYKMPVKGEDLYGGKAHLYGTTRDVNAADFKIEKQTYFKRVIVWYDPSSNDFNNSAIQLIIENCGPNIKAFRGDNATISYPWLVPSENLSPEELQFQVTKYQITRYRLNDNGEWVVDQRKPEVATPGKTIGDFTTETTGTDENLPSGTYRYEIDLTYVNGSGETITRNAVSNEVTLYDASAPVQAVSYQRVVEAGEKDLDGTAASEKLYSFDAVLDLNISSTALSQSFDGVYTRDLVNGYLIKIGETEMTDLNVTKLYVNGKEYAKTFYTDNSKTVYVGGKTETLSGYWMEVPFADFGGEVKLSLRWENCAKQEPGPAYNYEVFLIPDADKISQFAAAQFGSTKTRFEMHIPGITFNWDNSGIAQREFDGTHDDNCLSAMPMGTHLDAANLYAPIHYTKVNYLYANGKLGTAPVTESVRRGFDIVVKAGTAADNLAETAEGAAYNVKDIAIDQYANEDASFPCERNLMKLQGAPAVLVHGWSAIDYVRKELVASETEKRHMGRSEAKQGGIATIVLDPLAAPDFSTDKPQVTGTFMDTDAKVRYSVHNLYLLFSINNGVSAQANGTELFRTVGFYVAPETQTVPAAFIPANDKSARGGIVAHESNKGEFSLNAALVGYTPFEATSGFSQDNNWSEMAYNQEHLPVIVNYYAAKQGNTEMTGSELPTAKATLTYHYPFMSGDHVLTLTEGTTKSVNLSDAAISTGIEGVSADLDGEVTYYNMQGIRVENPVEGQVYLEVSAAGVRKVMK